MVILDKLPELKELKVEDRVYKLKVLDNDKIFDEHYQDLYDFCNESIEDLKEQSKREGIDLSQSIRTRDPNDWKNNNECLMYRIYKQKKYSNGEGLLNLVYLDGKIVGLSGAELFAENAISVAKRLFVLSPHRVQNFTTRFFVPSQNQWFNKHHPSVNLVTASFEPYLKNMIFRTMRRYRARIYAPNEPWNHWVEWEVYPHVVLLNYTPQNLVYLSKDGSIKTHEQLKERLNLVEVKDEEDKSRR